MLAAATGVGSHGARRDQLAPRLSVVGEDRRTEDPGKGCLAAFAPTSGLSQQPLEPVLDHFHFLSRCGESEQDDPPMGRLDAEQGAVPRQRLAKEVPQGGKHRNQGFWAGRRRLRLILRGRPLDHQHAEERVLPLLPDLFFESHGLLRPGEVGRESQNEAAPQTGGAHHGELAAVGAGQLLRDRQAEAGPTGRSDEGVLPRALDEGFEDPALVIRGNARAGIGHRELQPVAGDHRGESHSPARGGELEGVSQQIGEDLAEPVGVRQHRLRLRRLLDRQADAGGNSLGLECVPELGEERSDLDLPEPVVEPIGLDPRQVEEVVDDPRQSLLIAARHVEKPQLVLGQRAGLAAADDVERVLDRGEGGTELVRDR